MGMSLYVAVLLIAGYLSSLLYTLLDAFLGLCDFESGSGGDCNAEMVV